jgi:hypothetical protein
MIGDPVVNLAYLAVHALLRSQEIKRRPAGGATVIDDRQTIVLSRVSTSTGIFLSGGSKLKGGHPAVYSAGDVTSASEKRDSSPPRRLAPTTFASFAGAHL